MYLQSNEFCDDNCHELIIVSNLFEIGNLALKTRKKAPKYQRIDDFLHLGDRTDVFAEEGTCIIEI